MEEHDLIFSNQLFKLVSKYFIEDKKILNNWKKNNQIFQKNYILEKSNLNLMPDLLFNRFGYMEFDPPNEKTQKYDTINFSIYTSYIDINAFVTELNIIEHKVNKPYLIKKAIEYNKNLFIKK